MSFSYAQQTDYVDFKRVEALVVFNQLAIDSTTYNSYQVHFDMLNPKDSIYLDAVGMKFDHVALNNKAVDFKNDGKKLIIYYDFKKGQSHDLSFIFLGVCKFTLIVANLINSIEI